MGIECCNDLNKTNNSLKLQEELQSYKEQEEQNRKINDNKSKKRESNESSIAIDKSIRDDNDISILIIGIENDDDFQKLLEEIDNYFFGKQKTKSENQIEYIDNNINYIITLIKFENITQYSNNKFDLIISFSNDFNEINNIFKTFNNSKFIFKKILEKKELLKKLNHIQSNNILLTNDFEKQIINYFKRNSNKQSTTENAINYNTNNLLESIIKYFKCPLSNSIMRDPVITPYGHHYERKYIENEIDKSRISPFTKKPLEKGELRADEDIKEMIKILLNKGKDEIGNEVPFN